MIDRDRVQILGKALKFSASNHHSQKIRSNDSDNHYGYHWQHCPSSSCTEAFIALVRTKIFTQKDIDVRERKQKEYKAKFDEKLI